MSYILQMKGKLRLHDSTFLFKWYSISFFTTYTSVWKEEWYNAFHISIVWYNIAQTIPCNYQDIWALVYQTFDRLKYYGKYSNHHVNYIIRHTCTQMIPGLPSREVLSLWVIRWVAVGNICFVLLIIKTDFLEKLLRKYKA